MSALCINGENRRVKSFLFLIGCVLAGSLPHCIESTKSLFPAITLAIFLGFYAIKVVFSSSEKFPDCIVFNEQENQKELPSVDILVSARDEEAVVGRLVQRLFEIRYPQTKIKICVINDGSQDSTPLILKELNQQFSDLKVVNRSREMGGGKSGALNHALKELNGKWVFVLDADAGFSEDILLRLIPFANEGNWSAVQLRKAVVNSQKNLLTRCQAMEMAMDTVIQQGRQAMGGVVELRGNGALLNRKSLDQCGGFNEDTVTDDLDLSFRLLISGFFVGILWDLPVEEEGVETLNALIRQRKRWAEGGLQRFFDYWPLLISNRIKISQKLDLAVFFLLQYALPVISFVDLLASILTKTIPAYFPLSIIAFSVSGLAYFRGCRLRVNDGPPIPNPNLINLFLAIIYLSHWFFIIPLVTLRMAFRAKTLVWAKTIHKGN